MDYVDMSAPFLERFDCSSAWLICYIFPVEIPDDRKNLSRGV